MPQGLEEMKETAREINEAVALGKETEAGINEVNPSSSDASMSASKYATAYTALLCLSTSTPSAPHSTHPHAIAHAALLCSSKSTLLAPYSPLGGRKKNQRRFSSVIILELLPEDSGRKIKPFAWNFAAGSRGVQARGRGGFPHVLHAPQAQHRGHHVPVQPGLFHAV